MSKAKIFWSGSILITLCISAFFGMKILKGHEVPGEPFSQRMQRYYFRIFKPGATYIYLHRAYYQFHVPQKGVIHIGARCGEELDFYEALGVKDLLWIEADLDIETQLKKNVAKHPGSRVAMFAAGDHSGKIQLHRTSNEGHSSSILKLKEHKKYYPGITEVDSMDVPMKRLDDYLKEEDNRDFNAIVIDIQGAELIALRGAVETLKKIDAIITEINYDELYEGGVFIQDLDQFLSKQGFTRVDTISGGHYTGDALYIRNEFFKGDKKS